MKNPLKHRHLKAQSLAYAMIISVFVLFFLLSYLMIEQLHWKEDRSARRIKQLMDNANSGVYAAMLMPNRAEIDSIDLFDDGKDWAYIDCSNWGLFTLVTSQVREQSHVYRASAFIGNSIEKDHPFVMTLADKNAPLSLAGKTEITGRVRLPEAGVKRAYIEGTTFQGDHLINGKIESSESNLPEIQASILVSIEEYITPDSEGFSSWPPDEDRLHVSFSNPIKGWAADGTLYVQDMELYGKIHLYSSERIVVGASSRLEGVILSARVVEFEAGFTGSVQVFASQKIELSEDVELNYPSCLTLVGAWDEDQIVMNEGSTMTGLLLDLSPAQVNSLVVLENSRVEGVIYCANRMQLRAELNGALYADEFYLKTASSVYGNHLLNATVHRREMEESVLPSLFDSHGQKIMRWLD